MSSLAGQHAQFVERAIYIEENGSGLNKGDPMYVHGKSPSAIDSVRSCYKYATPRCGPRGSFAPPWAALRRFRHIPSLPVTPHDFLAAIEQSGRQVEQVAQDDTRHKVDHD